MKIKLKKNIIFAFALSTTLLHSEVKQKENKDFLGSFYKKDKKQEERITNNNMIFGKYKEDRNMYYKNERNKLNIDRYKHDSTINLELAKLRSEIGMRLLEMSNNKESMRLNYNLELVKMDYAKKIAIKKKRELVNLYIHHCSFSADQEKDYCNSYVSFKYFFLKKEADEKLMLKQSSTTLIQPKNDNIESAREDEEDGRTKRTNRP